MFGNATQSWFDETFPGPTPVQQRGWETIAGGAHALLVAPTGSGKTLAAFLAGIDRVSRLDSGSAPGTRVLYVSPLKALVYDVERNLRAPLAGIRRRAELLGEQLRELRVSIRTGDTPARERQRQLREPGDILVTTPESLFLILGSRARETLRHVHTVIVDEVHALAPTKRGVHLAVSLERLAELTAEDPQRIGLSATVRPLEEIARFLGGHRSVEIVDASSRPALDLQIRVPVKDMTDVPLPASRDEGGSTGERGIWPAIYPELVAEIRAHRSTIIFVNSRGLCERLAQRLNDHASEELVLAHHGSVSHTKRTQIEEALKAGQLQGIVATSSLELGIDMGAVDQVLLVESPGSVARGLQRVGRAGHQVDTVSVGRIYPKFRGDLLECAVVAERMLDGAIEALRTPQNALDVLAQQVVAICCDRPRKVEEIATLVGQAYPYQQLSAAALTSVLDMLSGRYPSTDFADLRPRLSWDRSQDVISARRGAELITRMNAGTIPDRGAFGVFLGPDGPRVGELDEEMVFETRIGDNILLGATTWRVEEVTRDRVVVTPAPGESGRLPFWKGDGPGRPLELGFAIGAFVRELAGQKRDHAVPWLEERCPLDRLAAENLAAYVTEQIEHSGAIPTDREIVVERFRDELGDWRICILTPFGARVHAPWAMAIQRRLSSRNGFEVQLMHTEDGIALRLADSGELPDLGLLFPPAAELEDLVTEQLADTALFASLFRENAGRSLLIPRRRPTQRTPLWAQRLKAQSLLATVRRYPTFPVVLETFRQALRDTFDLPGLRQLFDKIERRELRVREVEIPSASPFAQTLMFTYVASYMYDEDAPTAERRARALTVDRQLLSELLGRAELRELIDSELLAELEADLQCLSGSRQARDVDELHDLLRRLGDLSPDEIGARVAAAAEEWSPWLERLERERRAAPVPFVGGIRWIAAEDAGLYRDALGVDPAPGLPPAFLEPRDNAIEEIVRRFARQRGPFLEREFEQRYPEAPDPLGQALARLEKEGVLVRGDIRPGGREIDLCDAEVLRRLKRGTLARLRREVAAVDGQTLGTFLPQWHGLGSERGGSERLLEVIEQLQGCALPWSQWSQVTFPARVASFHLDQLDMLAASGEVVWVGRSRLGERDGRVSLYSRDHAARLLSPPDEEDGHLTPPALAVLEVLRHRGASFFTEILSALNATDSELSSETVRSALWALVWAGHLTNDTFGPLHSLRAPRRSSSRRRPFRSRTPSPLGGRWALVRELVDPSVTETERAVALAHALLERYGIVTREAAHSEDVPGGFQELYKVYRAMEESGQIRRGYFVEGLGGAQFADTGTIDRLRAVRLADDSVPATDADVTWVAANDPANPYGALLPWPGTATSASPRRVHGAWTLLVRGRPALFVSASGRQIMTFRGSDSPDILHLAFHALSRLPRGTRRGRLVVEKIDDLPVADSPHSHGLRRCGFERTYRGLACTGSSARGHA